MPVISATAASTTIHATVIHDVLEALLVTEIEAAQRHGDIRADADPRHLGALLLAVLRGIEALGKAGKDKATLRAIVDTALAVLPRSPQMDDA